MTFCFFATDILLFESITARHGELYIVASKQGAAFFKVVPKIKQQI